MSKASEILLVVEDIVKKKKKDDPKSGNAGLGYSSESLLKVCEEIDSVPITIHQNVPNYTAAGVIDRSNWEVVVHGTKYNAETEIAELVTRIRGFMTGLSNDETGDIRAEDIPDLKAWGSEFNALYGLCGMDLSKLRNAIRIMAFSIRDGDDIAEMNSKLKGFGFPPIPYMMILEPTVNHKNLDDPNNEFT